MTTTLKQLLAEREALEHKITELRAVEQSEAIIKIRALVDEYELTANDIFPSKSAGKTPKTSTTKVAAKYKDPLSGALWSGRGRQPTWLAGKNKEDFLIV